MLDEMAIWRTLATASMGILVGGAPSHFLGLHEKPSREEVRHMISIEAPSAVATELSQIIEIQNEMKWDQVKFNTILENLVDEIKEDKKR